VFEQGIPEIDVHELHRKLSSDEPFVLLDVREPWELQRSSITDSRMANAPMSRLAQEGPHALPHALHEKDAPVYVLCHRGVSSATVIGWLASQGWKNVYSVRGGIAAYASEIDPAVGTY
jgi:rhodanese-related sulfurtransferase